MTAGSAALRAERHPLRTLVFQSYRKTGVAAWIARCLASVRDWAARQGWAYEFLGDEFFDVVPPWFQETVQRARVPMSDLARLEWARRFLQREIERVIWVDADVAVFSPESFRIDVEREFAFSREVWISGVDAGSFAGTERVNNAVCVFVRGNRFLEYYTYACEQLARSAPAALTKISFGTRLLTVHHRLLNFPLLQDVAMLSPCMVNDLATGSAALGEVYRRYLPSPVHAGNFCSSLRGQRFAGMEMTDEVFEAALERMMATRGGAINRFIEPRS